MKPKCKLCGAEMYQTHSRKDFACRECGTEVSFWADPAGAWDLRVADKLKTILKRKQAWDAIRGVAYFVMFVQGAAPYLRGESNEEDVRRILLGLAHHQVHG